MNHNYILQKLAGNDDFAQVGISENKVNEMRERKLLIRI
jgi:hypothetical protein